MNDELDDLVAATAPVPTPPPAGDVAKQRARLVSDIEHAARNLSLDTERRPRGRDRKRAGLIAAAVVIAVIVTAVVVGYGRGRGHHRIESANEAANLSMGELVTPASPAEYTQGLGALTRFEADVAAAVRDRCFESAKIQLFYSDASSTPAFAPGFEDPTDLQTQGFDSVLATSSPAIAQAAPPGVDAAQVRACEDAGNTAVSRLEGLVAAPVDAWTSTTDALDHSEQLAAATDAWRTCMAADGEHVEWPQDVYALADRLGRSSSAQLELARVFGKCLEPYNPARIKARTAARTNFLANRDDIPSKAAVSSELDRLSATSGVPVPEALRRNGL